jgi:hypothetical protein
MNVNIKELFQENIIARVQLTDFMFPHVKDVRRKGGFSQCYVKACLVILKGRGKEQALKGHSGSGSNFYSFFNLGTRWKWVVKATPRPLCRQERDPVPIV